MASPPPERWPGPAMLLQNWSPILALWAQLSGPTTQPGRSGLRGLGHHIPPPPAQGPAKPQQPFPRPELTTSLCLSMFLAYTLSLSLNTPSRRPSLTWGGEAGPSLPQESLGEWLVSECVPLAHTSSYRFTHPSSGVVSLTHSTLAREGTANPRPAPALLHAALRYLPTMTAGTGSLVLYHPVLGPQWRLTQQRRVGARRVCLASASARLQTQASAAMAFPDPSTCQSPACSSGPSSDAPSMLPLRGRALIWPPAHARPGGGVGDAAHTGLVRASFHYVG